MKLSKIAESKWIKITGGANSKNPGYVWPYSHPHSVEEAGAGWYHGTTDAFLDSILDHGLDARGKGVNRAGHGSGNPLHGNPRNHLTRDIKLARLIARRMAANYGGNPIILEIDLTGTDVELIGSPSDSSSEAVIPPSTIVKVRRLRKQRSSTPID